MDELSKGMVADRGAFSLAALVDLPASQREVMRLLLRQAEMTYPELAANLERLPPPDCLSRPELDDALANLSRLGYVDCTGAGEAVAYRPRLRRRTARDLTPVDLHLRAGGRLPTGLWAALDPALDAAVAGGAERSGALPLSAHQPRAWLAALPLLWLLGTNALVLGLVDVVATSGFIEQVGVRQLPWLWIANVLVILLSSTVYATVVDRMPRMRLMAALLVGFAGLFAGVVWIFLIGAPSALGYLLLFLIAEQQEMLLPLAFWALASDLYTPSESKRVFPMLAAGQTTGMILGYLLIAGLAALLPDQAESPSLLLSLGGLLYLLGLVVLWAAFRGRKVRTRQSRSEDVDLRDTIAAGLEVTRDVPLFRYLAIAIVLFWVAAMPLQYHFISSIEQVSSQDASQFETLYGLYNTVVIVATLVLQSLVAGRLLSRIPLRSAPAGMPAFLLVAVGCALLIPGFGGAVSAYFLIWLVYDVWDTPVRHSLECLIPDERRGRFQAFVENYTYAAGSIGGSLVLGLVILVASRAALPDQVISLVSLIAAAIAAAGAVWAAIRLRSKYEESLFDWRLAKARHKSVLEGIEF